MSKRQRAHGGLGIRRNPRAARRGGSLLDALVGIGTGRKAGKAEKVPNETVQQAAQERRQRRLERSRANRELGAFAAGERPPRPANVGIANPGGERRRARERNAAEKAEPAK